MEKRTSAMELMQEAADWRLISLLFDRPANGWFDEVKMLGEQSEDKRLKRAAEAARGEAGEGAFHSIFGPGGPAPAREVTYRSWVQPGYLLSELSCFYDAFSYKPKTNEAPDHVAVETGFIAYLKFKELYALECGDGEAASVTAEAAENFVADHLSKMAGKLSRSLSESGYEYLKLAGEALVERTGPDKDTSEIAVLPVLQREDDELFECGSPAI
ncbi:MAG: molecular chaperone TorD family protein [Pyrinomonadaceae bacterium]